MNPKPKHRRFRFSLRTLLVLVTIGCIGFGWLGMKVRVKQRERRAVAAITELGGFVGYDYEVEWYAKPHPSYLGPIPPGPAWLRNLLGDDVFANVRFVNLPSRSTDEDLRHLDGLYQLRLLHLAGSSITDSGCIRLGDLSQLQELDLRGARVTDAGMSYLKQLRTLEKLWLIDTPVTVVGIKDLQQTLPKLRIYRLAADEMHD